MNIQEKIRTELQNPDFPDLVFLYSAEVLLLAPEILEELLRAEKKEFYELLEKKDEDITFDIFQDFSLLDYFFTLLEHYQGVNNDEVIRKIIEDFEPKYIDFGNEIAYSKRYYEMLKICLSQTNLNSEQIRILEKSIESYEVRGIALPEEKQTELKEISKKLSELSQDFGNNVLDSKKDFEYIMSDANIISQMPEDDKAVARKKAQEKNKEGYLFDASSSSSSSIMKYCSSPDVRKYFYEARQKFATTGEYNNTPVILETLKLRKRKAELLGFESYAALSLHFKMADSAEQIQELFGNISERAKKKVQAELDEITQYFSLDVIDVWDLGYYANQLREQKYAFDSKELKKYFVFEKVLAGMFEVVKRLYGIEMKQVLSPSYDPEVEVYEVSREGKFLAYFFTDYFYRPLKSQGAWANILRENDAKLANKKIVVNVCNFQKGVDGVTLLTLGDVETMFHEFGHATHEILSRSQYSDLSGFHVEWDFIELPSQLLENWCRDPRGMKLFAKHYETGVNVPEDMLQKLEQLDTFGNGQLVLGQNTYAMMDLGLHDTKIPKTQEELEFFIAENHDLHAILPRTEFYAPHTTFTHIFDGGYAAGYYSYMWAEIIEKEVWKAFKDSGDIFSPEIATRFHDMILSAGSTKKASELFQDFFGRDVDIDAFLQEKGLV